MALEFIKTTGSDQLVRALAGRLHDELATGHRVLWLISGGSSIPSEVDTLRQLHKLGTHLAHLTVMLVDERYGPVGHPDSNWAQLAAAGFDFDSIKTIPVLTERDASLESAVLAYEQKAQKVLAANNLVIGQLGLGADGHIAGILPHSPATTADWRDLVAGYQAPDFIRITLSPAALHQLKVAYLLANGPAKKAALQRLRDKDLPIADQPAQLLKSLPEVHIFSDQL